MKQIQTFKDKNIVVLGLGKTGFHVAKTLKMLGAHVVVNDLKTPEDLTEVNTLKALGVTVITGYHPKDLVRQDTDILFKNPGIPYTNSVVQSALAHQVPILTDVELAYLISQAPIVSITGSNGKTTTTTLIYEMLKNKQVHLAGNIGISSVQVAQEVREKDTIIMEMSSFQLKGIDTFKPHIAVITNIYDNHLDYHETREDYLQSKLNILKNQTETDVVILNGDLEESYEFAQLTKAKVLYFSKENPAAAYVKNNQIIVFDEVVMNVSDVKIPGTHNLENILAACIVAKLFNQTHEYIKNAVRNFTGVKHRSQFVREVNSVRFYNDSKATNILATQMALNGFDEKVILIAGGLDRGNGFETLEPSLEKVKTIVLYGETKYKIGEVAKQVGVETIIVNTLEEAIKAAYLRAKQQDVILFSPACASWDQFDSFEIRGDKFIEVVNSL